MAAKFESEGRRDEKPTRLFQQGYTRKNKDAIVIPLSSSNTPLNDTTKASDDSCNTDPKVHVPSPLTSKTATLNPQVGDQCRRYPFCNHKEPNKLSFSKSSSNVIYTISDFVSYHCLFKTHLAFAL